MPSLLPVTFVALLASCAFGHPSSLSTGSRHMARDGPDNPCATIAKLSANATTPVPGRTAYDCMNSMPFEPIKAVGFAESLKRVMKYHSTVDMLKSPPASYTGLPVDLLGGMDSIIEDARRNRFPSHFAFEMAINQLVSRSNDGHLGFSGLCSTSTFQFTRNVSLLSISTNGAQLPQVYTEQDAKLLMTDPKLVSPVATINGQRAESFLEGLSASQPYQDPDARYNSLFDSIAGNMNQLLGFFQQNSVWPGVATTELVHANGSATSVDTLATYLGADTFNYTSGADLYQGVCVRKSDTPDGPATEEQEPSPLPEAFPKPIFRTPNNYIAGFYPDSLNGTAVLFSPSFYAENDMESFISSARQFIEGAVSDGKKRLIIDLSGNGGGMADLGVDLFKLLFPRVVPYSGTAYRRHPGAEVMTKYGSGLVSAVSPNNAFDATYAVKPDQTPGFGSWQDLYAPEPLRGPEFTALHAYTNFSMSGIVGYGDGSNLTLPSQPFDAEDILVITDGTCTSTCNIFVELMRKQGGVKTVALGGRARTGPMTPSGGSKGAMVLQYGMIQTGLDILKQAMETKDLSVAEYGLAMAAVPPSIRDLPFNLQNTTQVNFLNAYTQDDLTTPLQFTYEPAECRLFYTAEMVFQPEAVWKAVSDAWWDNGACVPGSVN